MPSITLSKKDIFGLVGKKVSDDVLKDRISMMGTDLEGVSGDEINVEIFPNRPDMLNAEGFARALSSFIGVKTGLRKYKVKKSNYKVKVDKKVDKVRPYVACAVVKNVCLTDAAVQSLMQVQEKLHATHGRNRKKVSIGVYDLDTMNFPLNYTTKKKNFKFIPLEMDKELSLSRILSAHPKGRDYAHLLEGFDEYPIWLDAEGKVLSMPPIINSEHTRVTDKTKNLFIDATGLDSVAVEKALNILVTGLLDRGADVYSIKVGGKSYPDLGTTKMKIDVKAVNKLLGLELRDLDVKKLLGKMGYDVKLPYVSVPCYRVDVMNNVDLAEDVAIAYGYENFLEEIPNVSTIGEEDSFEVFKEKVSSLIVGFGYMEVNTNNLTSAENQCEDVVELENALNVEYNVLRRWMIPSLLEVFKNNKHYEYPQKIYEVGDVFLDSNEESNLCVLSCHSKAGFTEAKQILDGVFRLLGVDCKVDSVERDQFISGRVGLIIVKGKKVGVVGEICPGLLGKFKLENPVCGFEINLDRLFKVLKG